MLRNLILVVFCLAFHEMQTVVSDRFNKLSYQLGSIQSEIVNVKEQIQGMKKSTSVQQSTGPNVTYKLVGYNIPFQNLADFEHFDADLKENSELRQKVVSTYIFFKRVIFWDKIIFR